MIVLSALLTEENSRIMTPHLGGIDIYTAKDLAESYAGNKLGLYKVKMIRA